MSASSRLIVTPDPVARAIDEVVDRLEVLREPRLAVPGGSASAAVAGIRETLGPRWKRVLLTYTDERCVPYDSSESNRGALYRGGALLSSEPPAYELPLYLDGERPHVAAMRASLPFRRRFRDALDVVLLGLGPDGHIASLFPGHAAAGSDTFIAHVNDSPKPPPLRVTLTRSTLLRSTHHVVLAFGAGKRDALLRALREEPGLPTNGLPGLIFVTDQELEL